MSRRWGLLVAVLLLHACDQSNEAPPTTLGTQRALPPIANYESSPWSAQSEADDPVVATVNGVQITRAMLERELARSESKEPRVVLQRLIDLELLARQAHMAGHADDAQVERAYSRTLVRRYVETQFLPSVKPGNIPDDVMSQAYDFARSRYDRFDVFKIVDAQVICCPSENPDGCYRELFDNVLDRREHFTSCLRDMGPAWAQLRERVAQASDESNFEFLVRGAFTEFPSPALHETYRVSGEIARYDFQYDVNSTYEAQFERPRYQVFYKEIMDGVKEAWLAAGRKTPFVTPVIQSPIGHHLLYVYEVLPQVHRPLSDPVVQSELRERLFEQFRTGEFRRQTEELCAKVGCEVFADTLGPLDANH